MWQEGHTAHSFAIEAQRFAKKVIKIYEKFLKEYLAIPSIIGKKTPKEKFAGAVTSYTIESMMKDGKALQTGTSHYLGQNFSKSFNAEFKNSRNEKE
jgi:prolyl-tRNA synthetase